MASQHFGPESCSLRKCFLTDNAWLLNRAGRHSAPSQAFEPKVRDPGPSRLRNLRRKFQELPDSDLPRALPSSSCRCSLPRSTSRPCRDLNACGSTRSVPGLVKPRRARFTLSINVLCGPPVSPNNPSWKDRVHGNCGQVICSQLK